MGKVRVWVDEDARIFKVEFDGTVSSAKMPEDPDEGEPENVVGDLSILQAATFAWSGEAYFELEAREFEAKSGGHWSAP